MKKGKIIVISIDGADDGAVAAAVAGVAALTNVVSVNVYDRGEVKISKVCPVYTMDGLVRAAKRGELPGSNHVDETCLGGRVCAEEDV